MPALIRRTLLVACCALLSASPMATTAQVGGMPAAGVAWGWYGPYGPYGPYPYAPYLYGWGYAPWGACPPGFCPGIVDLRRAIRREMQLQELQREQERISGGSSRTGEVPFGMPRYLPPPTPESHLQPEYRGSGEIRLEYRSSGEPRAPGRP